MANPATFAAFWRVWRPLRPICKGVPRPLDSRFACRRLLCFSRVQARSFRRVHGGEDVRIFSDAEGNNWV
jgi:hypothetical protein